MLSPKEQKYAAVLVFPVRNEALILEHSIRHTRSLLDKLFSPSWLIVIAVNDSTDNTLIIANRLAAELQNVAIRYLVESGKGRAIRNAWSSVDADHYFFCDIDLSADLQIALPQMLRDLESGADIVTGSRALAGSVVRRPLSRKFFSTGYRWLAWLVVGTKFSDLPCGLKAVNKRVINDLVPQVKNNDWFFDSELLLLGERDGYKIAEVPVVWEEYRYPERPKKLSVTRVSLRYAIEVWRMRDRFRPLYRTTP